MVLQPKIFSFAKLFFYKLNEKKHLRMIRFDLKLHQHAQNVCSTVHTVSSGFQPALADTTKERLFFNNQPNRVTCVLNFYKILFFIFHLKLKIYALLHHHFCC